ncbi:hypothetical protein TIFTF001_052585 [Ficus carica]|uniref:Bet v I/Major latex protein domain-containing protein n=1 Tax=Ficus carica TaxID=3494 RepID=A0AA88EI26_FICCA|nr:hypothetical protein TIFTF001_052584 [Ficus carica]GMN75132.1 hypothetical protein TIFTF001_052585 [Ficus carica]
MGVCTYEHETTSTISPARIFKAFILDADNVIAKVAPHAVKHVEILEGNGGPGTIKKITFGEGSKFKYAKHRVDSVDHDNLTYCHSLIEGDILAGKFEKISHETKVVASPGGGSIVKATITYYTIGDAKVNEEHVKEGKEKATGIFKLVEGYLHANPAAYN